MLNQEAGAPGRFAHARRPMAVGAEHMVQSSVLVEGKRPVSCTPTVSRLDVREWLASSGTALGRLRDEHGAVLLRGFSRLDAAGIAEVATMLCGELLDYRNRSSPRTRVSGRVFTSTEYPADQTIPLHNEMSYTSSWPGTLLFLSMIPAAEGGETPLADSALVYDRLPAVTRERFERHGVMYVRNFGHGLDLSWQEAFQTADRGDVEAYCGEHGIQTEWLGGEKLRTRQVVQATTRSRATGKMVWFNQAHLFHISALPAYVEEELREDFAEDELPRDARYGDGSPLDPADLAEIRAAYAEEEIAFPWQAGDILIIDNEQFAHGRRPYSGSRSLLVAMA